MRIKLFATLLFISVIVVLGVGSAFAADTAKRDPNAISLGPPALGDTNGHFVHNYPLRVPPGRNGLQPGLSLTYGSYQSQQNSLFGYGWSLSIPSIERINRTGVENLYDEHYYYSSLSGELIQTATTTFVSKVDNGEFLEYTFSTSTWTVKDKQGTTYTFGSASSTRQDDPSDATRIFKWMLEEIRDTNDNYIKYEYHKDSGQIYPSTITYTGNDTTDGPFTVVFSREARPEANESFAPGFQVVTSDRISEIEARVDGTWVRKYELDYITGDNERRSMLGSITGSGQDEDTSSSSTLPAVSFEYQSSTVGYTAVSGADLPADVRYSILADVNGDTFVDVLYSRYNGSSTYLGDGLGGWTTSTDYHPPVVFYDSNDYDDGVRAVDVNGDGLTDLIQKNADTGNAWINTGSGWSASSTWAPPTPMYFSHGDGGTEEVYFATRIADVNGDGLPDLLRAYTDPETNARVYMNTGAGWERNTDWKFSISLINDGRLVDLNNDGLVDIIRSYYGSSTAYLNTGVGNGTSTWVAYASFTPPINFYGGSGSPNTGDEGVRFGDINGDGLPDMLRKLTGVSPIADITYLNTGDGWEASSSTVPLPFSFNNNDNDTGTRSADVDGDGFVDFLRTYSGDNLYLSSTSSLRKSDVLQKITHRHGGHRTVTYKGTGLLRDTGGNSLNPQLPYAFNVVTKIEDNDGSATSSVMDYGYHNGSFYHEGPFERRFAGFGLVESTDDAGTLTKTYYHQGDTSSSTLGEYSDDDSKIGKSYRSEVYSSSNNLYAKTITKWESSEVATGADFVKRTRHVEYSYDGDADHKDRAEEYSHDDTTGNLTEKREYGEVTGSDDGTFTDSGTDKFTTTYTYASNSSAYIWLPSRELVVDNSSTTVKDTEFYYDSSTLGSVSVGNLTRENRWISGSTYLDYDRVYDGTYGLVTEQIDPREKATTYVYDSKNLYPATSTNAKSQSTYFEYDYSLGKPKHTKDPNSRIFETVYDGLDRVLEVRQPDLDNPATTTLTTAYIYTDTSGAVSVQETHHHSSTIARDTYRYYDGQNRLVQTRKEAEASDTFVVNDLVYNTIGLLQKESLPYFSTGTSKTAATAVSNLLITHTYDPLQRASTTTNAVGSVYRVYDEWITTVTDPNGEQKRYYTDAYNNLVQVDESYVSDEDPYPKVEILDATLDALYHLEDGNDSSTNAINLSSEGDVSFSSGKLTNGASFDGTNDALDGGNNHGYLYSSSFTIAFWINADSLSNDPALIGKLDWDTSPYPGWMIRGNGSGAISLYEVNDWDAGKLLRVDSDDTISTGGWYHVAVRTDGTGTAAGTDIYINGSASDLSVANDNLGSRDISTSEEFQIGTTNDLSLDFDGMLDEIVMHDGILATSTITELFNLGTGKEVCTTSGCADFTPSTSSEETAYEYNYLGNLTKITDASGNERSFTYDGLGRRLTAEDLHSTDDTNYGSTTYAYDDAGNLTSVIDAKGQTINYTYDDINRQLTEDYTGDAGTEITYAYDSCTDGTGRLCTITKDNADKEFAYNALGLIANETSTIDGTDYNTAYEYNRQGSLTRIGHDDGSAIKHTYNSAGLLETTQHRASSGAAFANIVSDFDHAENELVNARIFDNCLRTTNTFNADELYRLRNITTDTVACGGDMFGEGGHFDPAYLESLTENQIAELIRDMGTSQERTDLYSYNTLYHTEHTDGARSIALTGDQQRYLDDDGAWKLIETEPVFSEAEGEFSVTANSFAAHFPETAAGTARLVNNKNYSVAEKRTVDERDFEQGIQAEGVSDVAGEVELGVSIPNVGEVDLVRYEDAYEFGDLLYYVYKGAEPTAAKLVQFDSKPSICDTQSSFSLGFTQHTGKASVYADYDGSSRWSASSSKVTADLGSALRIVDSTARHHGFVIDPPKIWDSNTTPTTTQERGRHIPIKTEGIRFSLDPGVESGFTYEKNIECSFFDDAVFPVFTDATFSGSPEGDSGTTTGDAALVCSNSSCVSPLTWSNAQSASASNYAGNADTEAYIDTASNPVIYRHAYTFDASGIWCSGIDVTSATTTLTRGSDTNTNYSSPHNDEVYIVSSSPAANDNWVKDDYDQLGSVSLGSVNISSWAATNDFALNSTGLSFIEAGGSNADGFIQLGARIDGDVNNSAPGGDYYVMSKFADAASGDPVLAFTYDTAGCSVGGGHQDMTYTYDAVGNITKITDTSSSSAQKTVGFAYDGLHRLTSASTSVASTTSYSRTYTYDALGNLTNKSDQGDYTYSTSTYANPHAVTDINGVALTYDNNGNLLTYGSSTFTWNYRNELISVNDGNATTTFGYDHTGQRTFKFDGTATTTFPTRYKNVEGSTTTLHIFTADGTILLATVESSTAAVSTRFIHPDHLGGTNVVTDEGGNIVQVLDYYPFGDDRVDLGTFDEQRQFTGHEFDSETDLTYANARYYEQDIGRWVSVDPASHYGPGQFLRDPQQLNGYSYGRNNPLVLVDRNGETVSVAAKPLGVNSWGTHVFLVIQPDNPSAFPEFVDPLLGDDYWILGAYNEDGRLDKQINARSDKRAYQRDNLKAIGEVRRPEGMSDTEYIRSIQQAYDTYGDDALYDPFARDGHNSNNFVSSLVMDTGGTLPFDGDPPGIAPGYGVPLPANHTKYQGQNTHVPQGLSEQLGAVSRYAADSVMGKLNDAVGQLTGALRNLGRAIQGTVTSN